MIDNILKNYGEPFLLFGSDFCDKICSAIDVALDEIKIVVYDWRFDDKNKSSKLGMFNDAIKRAVDRGVNVMAVVSNEETKSKLLKMGVNAKVLDTDKTLHTKLLIIDRFHIFTGSHNYTENAFSRNYEFSVYFILDDFDNPCVKYVENLFTY